MVADDCIRITGIRGHGRHGVFADERANGQEFAADIAYWLDVRPAAQSDELADGVDYGQVALIAHGILVGEPANLIETVAERIAGAVLALPGVQRVAVTVHKPQAPIPVPFDDVTITVERP